MRSWWDLIDEEKTGRIQASKVWMHIGFAIASYKFMMMPHIDVEMMGAYLSIVALHYGGMYYLSGKRGKYAGNDSGAIDESFGGNDMVEGDCNHVGGCAGVEPSGVRRGKQTKSNRRPERY